MRIMKHCQAAVFVCLISAALIVRAQTGKPVSFNDKLSITDVNGQPIGNLYPGVEGSPYFTEDYKYSVITLKQGRVFTKVKARIDMVTHTIHFISVNNMPIVLEKGTVREISFADTTEAGVTQYLFRTSYPAVDKLSGDNFYQVIEDGRIAFLKSITKKVTEKRNELSNEMIKEFENYEEYYLFSKGAMKRWKKDKDFFLAEMADKQTEITQFIADNKTNFRNVESVAKLVKYYNGLTP